MLELPPLSIYIHMPWCIRKCPYCDFNSHKAPTSIPQDTYINILIEQAKSQQHFAQDREIISIFFGGGTPNLIEPKYYNKLLTELKGIFNYSDNIEITMEANPGAKEADDFIGYRQAGINRISLGAQSFNPSQLKQLGRIHNDEQIITCFQKIKQANFNSVNIDLMYGLIEQTNEQAMQDLQQAMQLKPDHISWYQLTLEPNTVFAKYPPKISDANTIFEIEQAGRQVLKNSQYHQYEVSAYSQDNYRCQHNLNYWMFGDYLGLGAGAHGKITDLEKNRIFRTEQIKTPNGFMQKPQPYNRIYALKKENLAFEALMNMLRLQTKFDKSIFSRYTGIDFCHISSTWNKLKSQALTQDNDKQFWLTAKGHLFLNDILTEFLHYK